MTLPRLPEIIPADGSAAISDTQVQTHTLKHARAYKYTKPRKLPQPRYNSKAVIYCPMCTCAWVRMHVCVPDKGGGSGGGVLYSTHINHVEEK